MPGPPPGHGNHLPERSQGRRSTRILSALTSAAGRVDAGTAVRTGKARCGEPWGAAAGDRPLALGPRHLGLQPLPPAVQIAELALQVRLEPGPVLALELLELLDVLL